MTGTAINAALLIVVTLIARSGFPPISASRSNQFRWLLAGLALYSGISALYEALEAARGSLFRLLAIVFLALLLGNLGGRLMGLQKQLNRLGIQFTKQFPSPRSLQNSAWSWLSLGVVLALNPMTLPAAIQEGLGGRWQSLVVKSVLDAATMLSFGRSLTWTGCGLIIGVIGMWQSFWSLSASLTLGWLKSHGMFDAVLAEAALMVICTVPAIAGIRRASLADLTPALPCAALLAALWP